MSDGVRAELTRNIQIRREEERTILGDLNCWGKLWHLIITKDYKPDIIPFRQHKYISDLLGLNSRSQLQKSHQNHYTSQGKKCLKAATTELRGRKAVKTGESLVFTLLSLGTGPKQTNELMRPLKRFGRQLVIGPH
jgi:hypothetical protein